MSFDNLQKALGAALTIGVGIWLWQAVVTPLMNALGITSALQGIGNG